RVDAALVARRSDDRLIIAGKAASPLIDLARIAAGTDATAPAAGSRPGKHETHGSLPALLKFADLDLELQIGRLVLRDRRALTGISGRVALNREGLAVSAGHVSAGGAQWQVRGRMSNPAQGSGIDATLEVRGGELADQFAFWGGSITSLGPYQGSARAQGSLEVLRLTGIDAQAGRPGQARLAARGEIADVMRGEGFALALSGDISDPAFLPRLTGQDLPRLPPAKFAARFSNPGGKYAFDDLKLALGRTALQGRLEYQPGQPRGQVRTVITGTTLDLSEIRLPRGGTRAAPGQKADPLKGLAVDADFRLERLVLPGKQVLGPVSGRTVLAEGVAELHQVTLAIEGASAVLNGAVAEPLQAAGLDIALKANVRDSAALAGLAGVELPRLPPFRLSGRLSDVENGYALKGLQMDFTATRISGDLTATRSASRLALRASLTSPLFDVSEFVEEKPKPDQPATAAAERLFSDTPLRFGMLRAADAVLDLRIEKLRVPDVAPLGPVAARLALAGGLLKADPVRIGTPAGEELEISGTVRALAADKGSFALRIDGKSIDLGAALGQAQSRVTMSGGATDFRLQLASSGSSVRALMDALDGSARISVGPARIHREIADLGTGVIRRVFDLVNPFRKTDTETDLKCIAIRVSIADGVITSDRGIAVETAKYNVVASGTINLGTEALALGVTPTVNQGIALGTDQVAENVRIGGTLANPDIGIGMAGTARSAVSLYADVATAGGWLLVDALWRKSKADPNPCATALREPR
ncbi:MAG TPA: AsmA-like C-terminal region-containing protein, partial [Burkholderiales bacterium]